MKNIKGLSFITIMLIIGILSLLLRFGIERLIKINIAQNETNAQATLRLVSVALENYAKDHLDSYPRSLSVLTQNNPPYLDKNYLTESPIKGYNYNCFRLEASGYSCSATTIKCKFSGRRNFVVTTGGLLASEDCSIGE